MNSFFWSRAHAHLTNNTHLPNNGCNYKICQVKDDNIHSKYIDSSGNLFINEIRFSYIRPIHESTRLIVYNSSNIMLLEGIVHRGSKCIVEVHDGCMIVFTNNAFHAGVNSYERQGGNYLSHLRVFAYIVESEYVSIKDEVSKVLKTNEYIPTCETCEYMVNGIIQYKGHIIRYLDTKCHIDNLPMDKVLLGDLEKVG